MDLNFLLKPAAYIFILGLGVALRHTGFLKDGDHRVLSSIVLTLTLPAAIIRVFSQVGRDASLYWIVLLGFLFAALPIIISYIITRRADKSRRVYTMINMSGYNIGCFALPIIQNFFGAHGAVISCMFDVGNGIVAAGGAYAVTSTVMNANPDDPPTAMSVVRKLMSSVPFVTYIILMVLNLMGFTIPTQLVTVIDPIASANSFLAMFMVGAMFKLEAKGDYIPTAVKLVGGRFLLCAVFAALCVLFTPFDPVTRRVLAMLAFAPIASLAPTYTERAHSDGALASFTNSLSVVVSLITMLVLAVLPL